MHLKCDILASKFASAFVLCRCDEEEAALGRQVAFGKAMAEGAFELAGYVAGELAKPLERREEKEEDEKEAGLALFTTLSCSQKHQLMTPTSIHVTNLNPGVTTLNGGTGGGGGGGVCTPAGD